MATEQQKRYQSYLLRLWQAGNESTWRASLESPLSGERRGFASLKDLFVFLEAMVAETASQESDAERGDCQAHDEE